MKQVTLKIALSDEAAAAFEAQPTNQELGLNLAQGLVIDVQCTIQDILIEVEGWDRKKARLMETVTVSAIE